MRIKQTLEKTFLIISPLLKPSAIQRLLRFLGLPLPYFLAKHLNYRGLVPFVVRGQKFLMRSYNTPIEITIFWKGLFDGREGDELKFWDKIVQDADVILDIGANNGVYSLVSSANQHAKIYAFEPVPSVFKMLKENIALNDKDNITAMQMVVGEQEGEATLYVPYEGYVDIASLEQKQIAGRSKADAYSIPCQMTSVDAFLKQEAVTLNAKVLCKIDVEGAELRVIRGMKESLESRNVSFMVEILNPESFSAMQEMLPARYGIYPITKNGLGEVESKQFDQTVKNYFCKTRSPSVSVTKK